MPRKFDQASEQPLNCVSPTDTPTQALRGQDANTCANDPANLAKKKAPDGQAGKKPTAPRMCIDVYAEFMRVVKSEEHVSVSNMTQEAFDSLWNKVLATECQKAVESGTSAGFKYLQGMSTDERRKWVSSKLSDAKKKVAQGNKSEHHEKL
jgi:hypothetical protein